MPNIDWHFLENQFDNSTETSFKRAHQQGVFHLNAIPNAPGGIVSALGTRFSAAWGPFAAAYGTWLEKRGLLRGATQAFEERLARLAGFDIELIETSFKNAYGRGTPEHTSAFPQGREPFQRGGMDTRISALATLRMRCENLHTSLDALLQAAISGSAPQAEIDALQVRTLSMGAAFSTAQSAETALSGLRGMQDDLQTETELARTGLHPLRLALCDAFYGNLGQLMSVLSTEGQHPQIAAFFDLRILRETGPDEEEPPAIPPPTP